MNEEIIMQLVTVRFTTKKLSSVFENDVKVRDIVEEVPQVIAGIPPSTAQSYRKFGNWSIEPYVSEPDRGSRRGRANPKAFAKKVMREHPDLMDHLHKAELKEAAASGDLSAAINAGLIDG
jgi:hypothetical protein